MKGLASVVEFAVKGMCYAAYRGGLRSSRDRKLERQRLNVDLRDEDPRR